MVASRFPASWQVIGRTMVDWWDSWFDLVGVVVVWLLAQFTIVLGPPATFGLYYVIYRLVNGESLGVRGLIEGARKNFGAAWLWNIINLFMMITLYANIVFYRQFEDDWRYLLQVFFAFLIYLWLAGQFYALPFFHEQVKGNVLIAIRSGVYMVMAAPFFTLPMMFLVVLVVTMSGIVILPIFMGIPAIVPLLGARAVQNRLVAFGIREREKTPKELERDESSRIKFPGSSQVQDGEGQVEK